MTGLIEELQGVSAGAALGWIVAIIGATAILIKYLERYRALRNEHDAYKTKVDKHQSIIGDLQEEVGDMKVNYDHLETTLNAALQAINDLSAYNKKRDMAELKDSIRHCYSIYHDRGTITEMEKESLEDLITSYEDAGGKNSFVHNIVQKEMYEWQVIR